MTAKFKYFFIALLTLITLNSCRTVLYVDREVPIYNTKIEYQDRIIYDSIHQRDSVFLKISGDTVYKYVEKTKVKYLERRDTIIKVDTISIPIKIETTKVITKNELKLWQKILMVLGLIGIGSIISKLIIYIKKWT